MDGFGGAWGSQRLRPLGSEANSIAPQRGPLLTSTLVLGPDKTIRMVAGSPGGSRIITSTLQVILHVLACTGMDGIQAVAVPAILTISGIRQRPREPFGFSADTLEILKVRGHRFRIHVHGKHKVTHGRPNVSNPLWC